MQNDIVIRDALEPGDIGAIIKLHGEYYFRNNGFDCTFEPYVAIPLSEFVLRNESSEKLWLVVKSGVLKGCIAIARNDNSTAQLRWYLLDESVQGLGLGGQLIDRALAFAKNRDYLKVILWTVTEQEKAIEIYKKNGFCLIEEKEHQLWGKTVNEQCYEKKLK